MDVCIRDDAEPASLLPHETPHTAHAHTDARSCHRADPLPQFVLSVTLSVSLSVSSPSADGIWFYAAPGSGMWLCTGQRTLVLPQASDRPKLKAAWLEKVTEASLDRPPRPTFAAWKVARRGAISSHCKQRRWDIRQCRTCKATTRYKGQQRLWQSVLGACTGLSQSAPALLEAYSPQGFPVDTGMACIRACATVPNRH